MSIGKEIADLYDQAFLKKSKIPSNLDCFSDPNFKIIIDKIRILEKKYKRHGYILRYGIDFFMDVDFTNLRKI